MTSTQALTEKSGSHSCSYEQVYFNDMCRTNYNYIKNILNQYTSWNSGYIAAISAWIAKVNNNGDWDYKTSSYYGPWDHVFCNISDGQYDHVTSEYMGNYNYGYTGSCLFSLQTLELASFIVSGFDNSDIAGDWSTIESAFYTARAEQINVCPTNRWVYSYGRWYYFNSYGNPYVWYYFNSYGNPYVGWHEIDGCWYYFNSAGVMQTGWQQIDGCWYYLNSSGVMQTGWQQIDGYWYYLNSSGVMQTGWQQVDNYWYYLNSSGAMQTGWVTSGNSKYYMETSGAWSGWLIYGGYYYYRVPTTGAVYTNIWKYYNGYWYCINPSSSIVVTGWKYYGGHYYYMSPSTGVMYSSSWLNYNSNWYYFKSNGWMACSETLTVNGSRYTFDAYGRRITG